MLRQWFLSLGVAAILAVVVAPGARASDHVDPPALALDPGVDIADIYAFAGAGASSLGPNAVVVLTLVGEPELDVRYAFVMDRDPEDDAAEGLTADITLDLWFTPNPATEDGTPWCLNFAFGSLALNSCLNPAWYNSETGDYNIAFDLSEILLPPEVLPCTESCPALQIFAGMRDDPYFFDVVAFQTALGLLTTGSTTVCASGPPPTLCEHGFFNLTAWTGDAWGPTDVSLGPDNGDDFYAGSHVYAFVVEAPAATLGAGRVSVYAASYRRAALIRTALGDIERGPWVQVDRLGVPALSTGLFTDDEAKLLYNRASVNESYETELRAAIEGLRALAQASLAAFNWTTANGFGEDRSPPTVSPDVDTLLALIDPDVAHLNTIIPPDPGAPTGTPLDPYFPTFPNGRTLNVDVMDFILSLVLGIPVTDEVDGNDCEFLTDFPYLPATCPAE